MKFGFQKTLLISGALLASLMLVGYARELYGNYRVDEEIARLKEREIALENERISVLALKEKLQSADFLEAEARLKFGLKKQGETAIVLPGFEKKNIVGDSRNEKGTGKDASNAQLWWDYFFK